MKMIKNLKHGLLLVVLVAGVSASAQEVLDRIAAVVNKDVVLLSEIDEKVFLLAAQGQLQNADSTRVEQLRREILDRLVEEKLIEQRAKSQGFEVSDAEITAAVDQAVERVKERYPNPGDFQKALDAEGITLTMLRERYEGELRRERMMQMVVGREIRSRVNITSEDVEAYYAQNKDQLPGSPEEILLAHVLAEPVTAQQVAEARQLAGEARERLVGGEDWESLAKDYRVIEEPQTYCKGDLDPAFESALSAIEPGGVTMPLQVPGRFHVFQLVSREGDCFELRFLMVQIPGTQEDADRALSRVEEARERVLAGEDFAVVAAEVSDDADSKENGGELGWVALEGLLPEVAEIIKKTETGDITGVAQSERGFHVFKVLDRRAGRALEYDEIQDELRQYLEQQELEKAYTEWLADVRDSAYVEIKAWSR